MQATIISKHITKEATTLYQFLQLFVLSHISETWLSCHFLFLSMLGMSGPFPVMIRCILCVFKTNKHLCVHTVRILPVVVWVEKYYLVKNVTSHLWLTGTCIYWFQCVGFTSQSTDSLFLVLFFVLKLVTSFNCVYMQLVWEQNSAFCRNVKQDLTKWLLQS